MIIDPVTRQRIVCDKHSFDVQYDMVGDSSITEEVIPVVGNWEDYTGSAIVSTKSQMYGAGLSNELDGTDPGIMGEKVGQLDETGNNKQTTRRRVIKKRVLLNGNC